MKGKGLLAICLSILGGALIIGGFIFGGMVYSSKAKVPEKPAENRYEMISHDAHLIVFDKQTGSYWDKFIDRNAAPTKWEKVSSPVASVK